MQIGLTDLSKGVDNDESGKKREIWEFMKVFLKVFPL